MNDKCAHCPRGVLGKTKKAFIITASSENYRNKKTDARSPLPYKKIENDERLRLVKYGLSIAKKIAQGSVVKWIKTIKYAFVLSLLQSFPFRRVERMIQEVNIVFDRLLQVIVCCAKMRGNVTEVEISDGRYIRDCSFTNDL
jgi:hypothetical protein